MQTAVSVWLEESLNPKPSYSSVRRFGQELLVFGIKNALSCLFPVFIFGILFVTQGYESTVLPRYDLLLIACLCMQVFMYFSGLETKDELKVICLFHLLGLVMEIYKVNHGAWSYPAFAYTKVLGVPLFSGFMYASVASFMTQSWRYFRTELHGWPRRLFAALLGAAIYLNFFTNEYVRDIRWLLIPILFILFWNTHVSFTTTRRRSMPVTLSFLLICFFIWIAENIATSLRAWQYEYQEGLWRVVNLGIIGSWFLLVIVSFILVAELKRVKDKE
jgi:uncharacterized membrane protein YoaT (DUF817 family)